LSHVYSPSRGLAKSTKLPSNGPGSRRPGASILLRSLHLIPQMLQGHFELAVLEAAIRLAGADDFQRTQVIHQRVCFAYRQCEDQIGIGSDAPDLVVAAGRTGLVQVLVARAPQDGRGQLE